MDDYLEIDLREIVKKILVKWYWIIIAGFAAGLVAFLISYFQPNVYQVATRFILTDPLYNVTFGTQSRTSDMEKPSEEVLRSIVLSDEIVSELANMWEGDSNEPTTLQKFKEDYLSVSVGGQGTLVSLIVKSESREQTAAIANAWSGLAIDAVNNIYYGVETDWVGSLKAQMLDAQTEVDNAGNELIAFSSNDPSRILQSDLDNLLASMSNNNQTIRMIKAAREDAAALVTALSKEPSTNIVDPSYRLSFSLIQVKVLNVPGVGGSPYGVMVDYAAPGDELSTGEFITLIENWSNSMADRIAVLEAANDSVSADIINLQAEIKDLENESNLLQQEYQRQQDLYNILATKYEEVRLSVPSGASGYVYLVSKATVPEPEDRLPHNTMRNTLIAGVAGGLIAIVVIVVCNWWCCEPAPDPKDEE
ncbi:MAG: hypothetical protein H0S79_07185 [Anaerolineaceae bacterium]|nr:hypothetical protein [Anaerolineaceae bacterium]